MAASPTEAAHRTKRMTSGTIAGFLRQAHDLANRIEAAVEAALPGLEVTIHIEPIEAAEAWADHALRPFEETRPAD